MAWTTFDISNGAYANKSVDISAQVANPFGLFFKTDGTKMYILDNGDDTISQYALSTAWDVSTATYETKSYTITEDTGPTCLFFKSDGSKMYVGGFINDRVYQYSLSTPWDVSTATYDTKYSDISAQTATVRGVFFKSDGLIMYVIDGTTKTIYQYNLSTAWDASTATYANSSFDYSGYVNQNPRGLFVSDDGKNFFFSESGTDRVYQFTFSTGWDLSSYSNRSFLGVGTQDGLPSGIYFKMDDGSIMYVGGDANNYIYQYTIYTPVSGPANLKSVNGLAKASIKSVNNLAIGSIKSYNGLN